MKNVKTTEVTKTGDVTQFWQAAGYSDEEWAHRKTFETQYNKFYEYQVMYEEDLDLIG